MIVYKNIVIEACTLLFELYVWNATYCLCCTASSVVSLFQPANRSLWLGTMRCLRSTMFSLAMVCIWHDCPRVAYTL